MLRCKPSACIMGIAMTCLVPMREVRAQDQLLDLQRKSDLSSDDMGRIDAWLKDRVANLERGLTSDQPGSKAPESFTDDIVGLQASATPSFKRVFAERAGAVFAEKARSSNGQVSYVLLDGLDALGHPATLAGYLQAVDAPDAAVRLLAVRGIRQLASRGGGGEAIPNDQVPQTIQLLTEAGKRESNDTVLEHLYASFAFGGARDEQAKAIVAILETRIELLKAGKPVAESSDIEAYGRLQDLAGTLPEAEQARLVRVVASYLATYCHRLIHSDSAYPPEDLLRLTVSSEKLLGKITSVNGGVRSALRAPDAQRELKILEASRAWFGTSTTPGALNAGRWQVPIGGGMPKVSFDD